jgi:hypothetical protein
MAKPAISAKPVMVGAKPLPKLARPGAKAPVMPAPSGKSTKRAAKQPGRRSGVIGLFLGSVLVLWLAITALPVAVLLALGMIPSMVAYTVDDTPRRGLTFTVGPLNFAGAAPFCVALWFGTDTVQALGHYVGSAWVWLAMYAAAGAGWLLHLGMPLVVRVALERSIAARRKRLLQIQSKLRTEWGNEVDPSAKAGSGG